MWSKRRHQPQCSVSSNADTRRQHAAALATPPRGMSWPAAAARHSSSQCASSQPPAPRRTRGLPTRPIEATAGVGSSKPPIPAPPPPLVVALATAGLLPSNPRSTGRHQRNIASPPLADHPLGHPALRPRSAAATRRRPTTSGTAVSSSWKSFDAPAETCREAAGAGLSMTPRRVVTNPLAIRTCPVTCLLLSHVCVLFGRRGFAGRAVEACACNTQADTDVCTPARTRMHEWRACQ